MNDHTYEETTTAWGVLGGKLSSLRSTATVIINGDADDYNQEAVDEAIEVSGACNYAIRHWNTVAMKVLNESLPFPEAKAEYLALLVESTSENPATQNQFGVKRTRVWDDTIETITRMV